MTQPQPPESPLRVPPDAQPSHGVEPGTSAPVDSGRALTRAAWYPPVAGDLITVHHGPVGTGQAFTETYLVTTVPGPLGNQVELAFIGCEPDEPDVRAMSGFYAGAGDEGEPLLGLWTEAGPGRLTIERCGERVHDRTAACH